MITSLKYLLIAIFLLTGNFIYAIPKEHNERYPRFDFNGKFCLVNYPTGRISDFEDNDSRNFDLPHDWSIEGDLNQKNKTDIGGSYFPTEIGWCRKSISIPASWKGKSISIHFKGGYMNSEVFIKGNSLEVHPYGYSLSCYVLTLNINLKRENVLTARADNSQPMNCRWYSDPGNNRFTCLIETDANHITHWSVALTTPRLTADEATVQIKTG